MAEIPPLVHVTGVTVGRSSAAAMLSAPLRPPRRLPFDDSGETYS
jgi:hypothetical protein